ncbi:hypothetical protein JI435_419810 [Parastagonospora nodorum SN15]|uniref:Uncharacterized protein n=1 Tax=Phaeosphaeria nodorum (strain SN15 / ATCC MYA-4574 / FGSC 10173) TaxID=321614 RepID=A0A7U2FE06_PHANO|nr:hypothetical protein JI435_419810 [Parastagonospora nodorum SN15]
MCCTGHEPVRQDRCAIGPKEYRLGNYYLDICPRLYADCVI